MKEEESHLQGGEEPIVEEGEEEEGGVEGEAIHGVALVGRVLLPQVVAHLGEGGVGKEGGRREEQE